MATSDAPAIALDGPLTRERAAAALERLDAALDGDGTGRARVVDLEGVDEVDAFGLAALAAALTRCRARGQDVTLRGASPEARRLAAALRFDAVVGAAAPRCPTPLLELLGERVLAVRDAAIGRLALLADGYQRAVGYLLRGGAVAREAFVRQLVETGWRGVPIVALLNAAIGVILAVQVALVLEWYGAMQFLPRFVGIAVAREIGPLMAAVVVAGRSGSAIAAEVGTMRATEETDALRMIGLPPRRYLVLPRFAALTLAVPVLALVAVAAGSAGGAAAGVVAYDLSPVAYLAETSDAVRLRDLGSGLVKAFFFGNIIAVVSCLNGLRLRGGTDAIGRAATSGVVQSIVAVVLFDAAFTALTKEVL